MAKEDQARAESIQARARDEGAGIGLMLWLAAGTELISPWWSKQRDADLRRFWRTVDQLAGAVYTMESRLKTVPFRIQPRDMSIRAHLRLAAEFERILVEQAEFGQGWDVFYSKFVEDLITTDAGAFAEIIGPGKPDGPVVGRPIGIAHLDSWRCQLTGSPEYPVLYQDVDGRRYKLHYTRVLHMAQMPSPAVEMRGTGFCAVSRCINIAQNLLDIAVYKQEKLGSRPLRALLTTGGGLDPDDVANAFQQAEMAMDSKMLKRYANVVVVGSKRLPNASIDKLDLSSLPDGFDERTSTTLGMAAIALAFGMDPRELFPALTTGATKAEALMSHIKQRGKGPGEILQMTERMLNAKFLPPTLKLVFDFQDDEQDRERAEIKAKRMERHVAAVTAGLSDIRTMREQMLQDGDLTEAQFQRMELEDGRLPDGSDVLTLFHSADFKDLLDLGVEDPLDIDANDPTEMISSISARRKEIMRSWAAANFGERNRLRQALAALDRLELFYGRARPKPPQPKVAKTEEHASPLEIGHEDLDLKGDGRVLMEAAAAVRDAAKALGNGH